MEKEHHRWWGGPTHAQQRAAEVKARQAELAKISKRHSRKKW